MSVLLLYERGPPPTQEGDCLMRLSLPRPASALAISAGAGNGASQTPVHDEAAHSEMDHGHMDHGPAAANDQGITKPTGEWRLKGHAMAAAADKRAVQAALDVMKQGGSAVDAALAAHAVLGLVEPQSSGLGGGGYMVVYDRASNTVTTIDGRETAPMGATAEYFQYNGK